MSLVPRRRNHFEKREGMKVGGMFKNPMTIMMILSMGMMFFLPKMMANLDPEQLEVSRFSFDSRRLYLLRWHYDKGSLSG